MAKCQLFSKAIKKSKKKLKKFIVHSPAGLFSETRQRYNALQRFFKNIYLPKRGKKTPKFPFKIPMVPNVRRGQEISVTAFALDFFNIPMILT